MSTTIDKLLAKGKAKVKALQGQSGSQNHQGYPVAPYQQGPPPQGQYPQYQQYPQPDQYQPYPPQQQLWGPSPNEWSQPPQQQQWGSSLPTQAAFAPPIPQASKPQSPHPESSHSLTSLHAPPISPNRPSSTQPPPPPPPTISQPSAEKIYWQPSFADSTLVTQNFDHELGAHGWGNNELQNYTSSLTNSFHHSNRLIIRAVAQHGVYTSARLSSHQKLQHARGYLTCTLQAPVAPGIWPAYWLLPAEPFKWPEDGEMDIFEAWNGEAVNHSCLHWGQYDDADWNKHRVIETKIHDMRDKPHTFGFAWMEEGGIEGWRGRLVWYVDGRPVMKANIPLGTRRLEEFRVLLNVAMGGDVCKGSLPRDGYYDLIVSEIKMCEEPPGDGWKGFERDWKIAPEGKAD